MQLLMTQKKRNRNDIKRIIQEWIEFREETVFCQDKKYYIYFNEFADKILKNVPEKNMFERN